MAWELVTELGIEISSLPYIEKCQLYLYAGKQDISVIREYNPGNVYI